MTCFLSYANQYTKPFNEISGVVTELQNAIACAGRLFELLEEESVPADKKGAIEIKNVDGKLELSHINFHILPIKSL